MEPELPENGTVPGYDEWSLPIEYEGVPIWKDGELAWQDELVIPDDDDFEGDKKPA